jgi:dephospho-CoA kinase
LAALTPYCVALTGGIGSGKSTVAALFAELGVPIIDTDTLSHALTQPGAAGYVAIAKAFGPTVLNPDASLNRAALRTLVFSDPEAKMWLEAILHPLIYEQVLRDIQAVHAPYLLIVVPLLFETGSYAKLVQRTLVVDCDEATQIARTMARSGLTADEVLAIMAHQLPRAQRVARADDLIHNPDGAPDLRQQVAARHAQYQTAATAR